MKSIFALCNNMFRFVLLIIIIINYIALGYASFVNNSDTNLKGELIFAQILYRHGDRTPVDPYPTDPWRDLKYWPTGWGQLTNLGKQQHYELGKWLRKRYSTILNKTYSKNSVYIQSTDVDRTLMSALSNLAGLFPPEGDQIWNSEIEWQPIPVHTIPEKQDSVLAAKKSCPAYDYALYKLRQSDEFKELDKKFKYLYDYLTQKTGRKISALEGIEKIYNTLFIEDIYNKTLPEWTKKVYPGGDMQWISAHTFAIKTYTRKLARLKAGPLLKEILERFANKTRSKLKPDRSLWIYSAHDLTVANLLNILRIFEYHNPPYTACVMLEMRLINKFPYISVFYKNTTNDPSPIYIPNCGISCPLDKMFDLYNDVLPNDWNSECELSMLSMTYGEANVTSAMAILACTGFLLLALIVAYIGIIYYRRRSYFDYRWYVQVE